MIAQGSVTVFGYVFWLLVSRLYANSDVGVASSLISMTSLISQISILGLNQALVRFFPKSQNKNSLINTALNPPALVAIFLSFIYILLNRSIDLPLPIIIAFVLSSVFTTLNIFTDSVFLANRKNVYNVGIYGLYGIVRVVVPFLFLSAGAFGIITANLIGTMSAVLASFYFMYKKFSYKYSAVIDLHLLRKLSFYSLGTYIAGFLWITPMLIAPTLALNIIGSEQTSYLYMVITVFNILLIIPTAVTQSLYSEGSHGDANSLRGLVKKTASIIYAIQILGVIALLLLGNFIMSTFGKDYASGGTSLLYLLVPIGLLTSINMIGNTILKIKNKISILISINALGSLSVVILMAYFVKVMGIIGVGFAYLIGQLLMLSSFAIVYIYRNRVKVSKGELIYEN